MTLNPKKSNSIIISHPVVSKSIKEDIPLIKIDGVSIKYSEEVKYLGVYLDQTLSPKPQIRKILSNVNCALAKMRHLKRILPNYLKLQLAQSLIFPIFDYGDIFYHMYDAHGFDYLRNKLQTCQNNVLRFILNLPYHAEMTEHRNRLQILKLDNRRKLHIATMMYQIINEDCPVYLNGLFSKNTNSTRQNGALIKAKFNKEADKTSLLVSGVDLFNSIDDNIKQITSKIEFKKTYSRALFENQTIVDAPIQNI